MTKKLQLKKILNIIDFALKKTKNAAHTTYICCQNSICDGNSPILTSDMTKKDKNCCPYVLTMYTHVL